jgi:hypothetical protein
MICFKFCSARAGFVELAIGSSDFYDVAFGADCSDFMVVFFAAEVFAEGFAAALVAGLVVFFTSTGGAATTTSATAVCSAAAIGSGSGKADEIWLATASTFFA